MTKTAAPLPLVVQARMLGKRSLDRSGVDRGGDVAVDVAVKRIAGTAGAQLEIGYCRIRTVGASRKDDWASHSVLPGTAERDCDCLQRFRQL